jgi:dipeptidyl aminopeptidase/acylaminoacyl peptidase
MDLIATFRVGLAGWGGDHRCPRAGVPGPHAAGSACRASGAGGKHDDGGGLRALCPDGIVERDARLRGRVRRAPGAAALVLACWLAAGVAAAPAGPVAHAAALTVTFAQSAAGAGTATAAAAADESGATGTPPGAAAPADTASSSAAADAPAGQPPQVPTEVFFRRAKVSGVKISPDGRHLAVARDDGLLVVDVDGSQPKAFFDLERRTGVADFWWLSDQRLLLSTSIEVSGREAPYLTGDYHAIDIDGTRRVTLFSPARDGSVYHRVIDVLDDDDEHILVQRESPRGGRVGLARPTAFKVDVYRGGRSSTGGVGSPLPNGRLYADHDGEVRLAVGSRQDDLQTQVHYRDPASGDWVDLRVRAGVDAETRFAPAVFTADNAKVWVTTNASSDTIGLYRLDVKTGALETIYSDAQADVSGLWISHDRTRVLAVQHEDGYPRRIWLDPDDPESLAQRRLEASFPEMRVNVTSTTRDGRRHLVHVSSDRDPGAWYLFDETAMKARFLFRARPDLQPEHMAPMHPFRIRTRDGLEVGGYLTLPRLPPGSRAPLIVLPHGGPHGVADRWGFDSDVQFLANRGFAVLQVNFRGSGGAGKRFEAAGYRRWGTAMIDDIVDATRWAAEQPEIDAGRMCIFGASYGGFAALAAVTREPDLFRCAVGYVGIYDLSLMHEVGDVTWLPGGKPYMDRVLGTDRAELIAQSPVHNAARIKVPVYIAHGGDDKRAPMAHARALRAALQAAGVPHVWQVEHGEGHGFYGEENRIELYDAIVAFVRANIGGGKGTAAAGS